MELLVIAILLTLTGAQELQFKGPENTLSYVGSNVTLKCLSPSSNCNATEWLKYSAGNPMTIFNHRGIISSVYIDSYSVDNKSGCDLIIRNVQLTDAGRFLCRAIISSNTVEKAAYLIILKTQPKCTINESLNETVENDGVQLTCEVTYNGTDGASMVWKDRQDAPAAVVRNKTISRSYSVVASAPEVPSFVCITSFALAADYNGVPYKGLAANRIPDAICATSIMIIFYSVRDATLSPSLVNYPPGTMITCTAKGNPSPSVKWQEMENGGTWTDIQNQYGSEFTMTDVSSKRYRCVAMNVVRGKNYNASSHEFQVQAKSSNATTTEIQLSNTEFNDNSYTTVSSTSVNCLGIGVGIGLLIAILLATVAFAILVRLRYIDLHLRPANKPLDADAQHVDHEMRSSSSHQRSAVNKSIPRTKAPLVGEQESTYASLEGDRDANEYAALELRQTAKPKK